MRQGSSSYQPGSTVLTFEQEMSPGQNGAMETLLWHPGDAEGSSNSEGSQATSDSGRYSHDETEMTNLSSGPSSDPSCRHGDESGGSDCEGVCTEPDEPMQGGRPGPEAEEKAEDRRHRRGEPSSSQPPLQVCESAAE